MQVPLVMTVIGRDRPGLVESVADVVARHGGNWLESRMCRLGGEFAGILRVHVDSHQQQKLQEALTSLRTQGLDVVVCSGRENPEKTYSKVLALELVGQDRPGIVRDMARALAGQGVNVDELATECSSAPMSGEALFRATARLQLPASCSLPDLRRELERIADSLMVDVTVEEVDDDGP